MNIKFFPKPTDIVTKVCAHRWGADATFSEQTDARYISSVYACEMFGFKNNVRLGLFASNTSGGQNDNLLATEQTGVIRHDIYFATDSWGNPVTGDIERIPDYYSLQWTALGVQHYANAVLGEPKADRSPNHGQQLYDISNGAYGYDSINNVYGTSQGAELTAIALYQKNWLASLLGRNPSAGSFRNGALGASLMLIPYFLGVRNSGSYAPPNNANTWYGENLGFADFRLTGDLNRLSLSNYYSSSRTWDSWIGDPVNRLPMVLDWIQSQINSTCQNKGWWRDFIHWHSFRTSNTLPTFDQLLNAVRTGSEGYFLHTCSTGEALEYLHLREIVQRVNATERNGFIYLTVDVVDRFKGNIAGTIKSDIDLTMLNIPLSVEVDLSTTSLVNKNIISNYGKIRALGDNKYIVEVSFSHSEGFSNVILSEGLGGYYNENVPTAVATIIGNTIELISDIPTKAVQYYVITGGNDYDSLPVIRSNDFKTRHIFTYDPSHDYRVGIISEFGQCNLIKVNGVL